MQIQTAGTALKTTRAQTPHSIQPFTILNLSKTAIYWCGKLQLIIFCQLDISFYLRLRRHHYAFFRQLVSSCLVVFEEDVVEGVFQ